MEIKPPTNNLYTAITRNISASSQNNLPSIVTPSNWKVAQVIQAVITQITDKQIFLDIQGVNANTTKPSIPNLQIGDTFKLQIEQLKPMPQFRIISLEKALNANILIQALKSSDLQSASTSPLLKDISFIATRPALRPAPLSADVNAAVRNIFKQIPTTFNLKTASQIKTQLQNSGIFIENKIKNQIFSSLQNTHINKNIPLKYDHKSDLKFDLGIQLHRLANLVRNQLTTTKNISGTNPSQSISKPLNNIVNNNTTVQQTNRAPIEQASLQNITQREEAMQTFLRQIESSLTHMQHTQLQNLNESQSGRPLWLMELPIKDGSDVDLFEVRISEEESKQAEDEAKKIWNVTLEFDLTGLGKIKAYIKMQNNHISAQFFSEKPDVLTLFRENVELLRNRFNYNGLNVGNIECTHAKLDEESVPVNTKRLDERT